MATLADSYLALGIAPDELHRLVAMASGAGRLLDEAALADDLPGALQDCTYVFATTARPRELTKPVLGPERAMAEARARIAESLERSELSDRIGDKVRIELEIQLVAPAG